jgi:hypothetical protein
MFLRSFVVKASTARVRAKNREDLRPSLAVLLIYINVMGPKVGMY